VGLGRQLLTELTGLAARRGVRRLTATVQADNAPVSRPRSTSFPRT
jgi:L-amino acid N-acyltransferase YncA